MHTSVGAIIKSNEKILMIDRATYPFGWACPAGHVDDGEKPEQALIRETKEETNLRIKKFRQIIHEFVEWNVCNRGVRGHDWYVYEIEEWSGELNRNKRETKNINWFTINEIRKLKLEEIWQYWFEKLHIL